MRYFLSLLLFTVCMSANAQPIYPELTGRGLKDALKAGYAQRVTLPYSVARDSMFGFVDKTSDNRVRCPFIGLTITLTGSSSSSCEACSKGLAVEFTVPSSREAVHTGASIPRDLHQMFPVAVVALKTRSALPYGNVPDELETSWLRDGVIYVTRPSDDRSTYSSSDGRTFEVRDDHKGNTARALFYVATMYEKLLNEAWIAPQMETLLDWHRQDPPDETEAARMYRVQQLQGNVNPFVLDTSLVRRAWFEGDLQPLPYPGMPEYVLQRRDCTITDVPVTQQPNVATFSDFYRSSSLACVPSGSMNGFGSAGWTFEPDTARYVGFTITPAQGYELVFDRDTLSFWTNSRDGGPRQGALDVLAGGRWTRVRTWEYRGGDYYYDIKALLPAFVTKERVAFRVYGWGGTSPDSAMSIISGMRLRGYEIRRASQPLATEREQPAGFVLSPAYPNPFNPSTSFTLSLDAPAEVTVSVYDLLGRRVDVLHAGRLPSGEHPLRWEAGRFASGLYLIRATAGARANTRKVLLVK